MCLTIPAKVISIDTPVPGFPAVNIKVEDFRGVKALKSVALPELNVGDWVLYAYDTVVRRVSEDDAREILELLDPKKQIDINGLDSGFVEVLKSHSTAGLSRQAIVRLLNSTVMAELETLYSEANTVRQAALKDFFCIHGIVEFSNHCIRRCRYCGLRSEADGVNRYRMDADEIVETVVSAVNGRGYKLIVLQSGDDFHYTDSMLAGIISRIKKLCKVFIFMSVGERSLECYRAMKVAGASGVLFRFETSKRELYNELHPGQSYEKRIELLQGIKGLGYYIASGFLVGLPGQTVEDIADDILLVKELDVNMATVGPFIPCVSTPLEAHRAGAAEMTLKVISILRLLMPKAKIPVTTALETIESEEGRRLGLSSGANSLMFNLTPDRYRAEYRIYPNKYHGSVEVWEKYGLSNEALSYRMLEKKMFEAIEAET